MLSLDAFFNVLKWQQLVFILFNAFVRLHLGLLSVLVNQFCRQINLTSIINLLVYLSFTDLHLHLVVFAACSGVCLGLPEFIYVYQLLHEFIWYCITRVFVTLQFRSGSLSLHSLRLPSISFHVSERFTFLSTDAC